MTTTHPYAGSDTERQSSGLPGHCDDCAVDGHLTVHPDLGCGDVGCDTDHTGAIDHALDPHVIAARELLDMFNPRLPGFSDKTAGIIATAQVHALLALSSAIRSLND